MDMLQKVIAGAVGVGIGVVTLRTFRNRRRSTEHEPEAPTADSERVETAVSEALREAGEATEHAAAAIEHARVAGRSAADVASSEFEEVRGTVPGIATREPEPEGSRRVRSTARKLISR